MTTIKKINPLITTKTEGSSEIKPLNFTDEMTVVKNVSEIDFEDETTKTTIDVVPHDYITIEILLLM